MYLAASKISIIPTDVFSELSELENFDLSHNQMTKKSIKKTAFGNMIKLEKLNLGEDLLAGVPQNLPSSPEGFRLDKTRMFLLRRHF